MTLANIQRSKNGIWEIKVLYYQRITRQEQELKRVLEGIQRLLILKRMLPTDGILSF